MTTTETHETGSCGWSLLEVTLTDGRRLRGTARCVGYLEVGVEADGTAILEARMEAKRDWERWNPEAGAWEPVEYPEEGGR